MTVEIETMRALDEPFLQDLPLPLRATVFPLGFPLEVSTNSEAVIEAARQSWSFFPAVYQETPLSLCLTVSDGGEDQLPARPLFRCNRHLMSIVSDAQNQVTCDLSRGFASGWVTRQVADTEGFLRLHFLESSVMTMLVSARLAPIHGALIEHRGVGVVLCGETFAGKSTLAYACARTGWTLISDDGTFLLRHRQDRYAVGNPCRVRFREDAKFLFPELAECRVALRPNGALGMEVHTSDLDISIANGCSIDHAVFLRRSRLGGASMNRLDPHEAQCWFERAPCYGPAGVATSQREAYRRLLNAELWELHYSKLSDAVQLLDRLEVAA